MQRNNPRFFTDVYQTALLLVEGNDDARFLEALLRHLAVPDIQIATVDGKDNFRRVLADLLPKADNYHRLRRLGIVRDADNDSIATFQSIRGALASAQLPVPNRVWESAQSGNLAVTVAILPDGTSPGELEDLCLLSLEGHRVMECIDEYMNCLANAEAPGRRAAKSRLHAYLASGENPGLRIGEAADAGVWDWESTAFRSLAGFLRSLSPETT
jgi:hypothetical protein